MLRSMQMYNLFINCNLGTTWCKVNKRRERCECTHFVSIFKHMYRLLKCQIFPFNVLFFSMQSKDVSRTIIMEIIGNVMAVANTTVQTIIVTLLECIFYQNTTHFTITTAIMWLWLWIYQRQLRRNDYIQYMYYCTPCCLLTSLQHIIWLGCVG